MTLDFKPAGRPHNQADLTPSITRDTISITDTTKGQAVGYKRHGGCLKIE